MSAAATARPSPAHQTTSASASTNTITENKAVESKVASTATATTAPQIQRGYGKMHSFLVNGTQFIVDAHYQPLKPIGTGAYGVVW